MLAPFHPIKQSFLDFLNEAKESIYICIYGFTLDEVTDLLIAKKNAGIKVEMLMDNIQAGGTKQKVQAKRLIDAGINVLIGPSPKGGIRHSKYTIIDGKKSELGSLNYSASSFKQNNTILIITSSEVAGFLQKDFDYNKSYLETRRSNGHQN